jgi:hypothetical protein
MAAEFRQEDWEDLIQLLQDRACTPFIGAGAASGVLPTGGALSKEWADRWEYPFSDKYALPNVAQYLAVKMYGMFPKNQIKSRFAPLPPPDFTDPDEPHSVLADLDLPIYITTNYDNFMCLALQSKGKKCRRDLCRWNDAPELSAVPNAFDGDYQPTPAEPLVYHLHGYYEFPRSLVLTQSDYLEFLIKFARDPDFLPAPIRTALSATALLFVGYSLNDLNFQVLFRAINSAHPRNLQYRSVAIQLPSPEWSSWKRDDAVKYLQDHLERIHNTLVRIYWGDVRNFMVDLNRWRQVSP